MLGFWVSYVLESKLKKFSASNPSAIIKFWPKGKERMANIHTILGSRLEFWTVPVNSDALCKNTPSSASHLGSSATTTLPSLFTLKKIGFFEGLFNFFSHPVNPGPVCLSDENTYWLYVLYPQKKLCSPQSVLAVLFNFLPRYFFYPT
jgi:hypothetical protein